MTNRRALSSILLITCLLSLVACGDHTTERGGYTGAPPSVLPEPKTWEAPTEMLYLSAESKLYTDEASLSPLLDLLATELSALGGPQLTVATAADNSADVILSVDPVLAEDEYHLTVGSTIRLSGGSYAALAQGKTTLLHLAKFEDGRVGFPVLQLEDRPDAAYRGLMIDLARKWHPLATVKQLIDLAAFYKVRYVQLHFTDYQSYTLPSRKYPKLSTPGRHYSFEDLAEMEAYAVQRGVTIIPEIDVPGHSSPFVKQYPEIFAIQDTVNNPWIINMGREEVYTALDELIGELTTVFKASPYFHIGGDEAIFTSVAKDPDVRAYVKTKGIGEDVHELYRHFLVRLNEIVKQHGKQTCLWEGFRPEGQIDIPRDMIVFEFETNRYLPGELIRDGYTVVNTSWKPLYVVNQKKWEPRTIYGWNLWRWENWWERAPSFTPIQLAPTEQIVGAQMCAWEQAAEVEIPSLRRRLPYFTERVWNTEQRIPFAEVERRVEALDDKLSLLLGDERQDSVLVGHNWVMPVE